MIAFKTADAAERLAKKQAAKQLGVGASIAAPVAYKVDTSNPVAKGYNYLKSLSGPQLSTPINTGKGVSMGGQVNALQGTVEPTRVAVRRVVGDVTAIPGVGRPSASPTAADIRAGNWAAPAVDYAGLALEVLPSVKPAYQEAKRVLSSAIAKSVPTLPIRPTVRRPSPISPADYQKLVQRQRNMRFSAKTDPEMFKPLEDYFSYRYPEYQDFLRQQGEQFYLMGPDQIDRMKNKISEIDALFGKAPPLVDPIYTYRGVRSQPTMDEIIENMQPGDVFSDPAFMSTSVDRDVANEFLYDQPGYIWQIEVPGGTQTISPHSLSRSSQLRVPSLDEREFLLPRNSQLEFLGRDNNQISARLLPPGQRRPGNIGPNLDAPTSEIFDLAKQQRRIAETAREYGIDLDEAAIMVEVEDDFRESLIRDVDRIASPETRQQFVEWVRSTPIEFIRAQDAEFNRLFIRMSEMGGFGE
jgi:hypothetical protein